MPRTPAGMVPVAVVFVVAVIEPVKQMSLPCPNEQDVMSALRTRPGRGKENAERPHLGGGAVRRRSGSDQLGRRPQTAAARGASTGFSRSTKLSSGVTWRVPICR
ncbi:hypothetical protein GCM10010442_48080 [Kitasatospora kifunensis]